MECFSFLLKVISVITLLVFFVVVFVFTDDHHILKFILGAGSIAVWCFSMCLDDSGTGYGVF